MRIKVLLIILLIILNVATYTSGEDELLTVPNENIYVQEDLEVDENGWNNEGFNVITNSYYDEEGYDLYGYDSEGYNKAGWQSSHYGEDIKNKYTGTYYDIEGYDMYGYDSEGYNKAGWHYSYNAQNKYTGTSYDIDGYDIEGWNEQGYNKETGTYFDVYGYDISDYDSNGYNIGGWNKAAYNRDTNTYYDIFGYDIDGYDKNGYDSEGYDRGGYDRYGRTKEEVAATNEPSDTGELKIEDKVPQKQAANNQRKVSKNRNNTSLLYYMALFFAIYLLYLVLKPSKQKEVNKGSHVKRTQTLSRGSETKSPSINRTPDKGYTVRNLQGRTRNVYTIGKDEFYKENGKYYNSRGDLIRNPEKYFRVVNANLYGINERRNMYTDWREWEERKSSS